jgi:hypothetical protein
LIRFQRSQPAPSPFSFRLSSPAAARPFSAFSFSLYAITLSAIFITPFADIFIIIDDIIDIDDIFDTPLPQYFSFIGFSLITDILIIY